MPVVSANPTTCAWHTSPITIAELVEQFGILNVRLPHQRKWAFLDKCFCFHDHLVLMAAFDEWNVHTLQMSTLDFGPMPPAQEAKFALMTRAPPTIWVKPDQQRGPRKFKLEYLLRSANQPIFGEPLLELMPPFALLYQGPLQQGYVVRHFPKTIEFQLCYKWLESRGGTRTVVNVALELMSGTRVCESLYRVGAKVATVLADLCVRVMNLPDAVETLFRVQNSGERITFDDMQLEIQQVLLRGAMIKRRRCDATSSLDPVRD